MKSIILTLISFSFGFLSPFISKSQDTIILKSGGKINAKILEIGISEIKYMQLDIDSSTIYSLKKSNLSIIKYRNGLSDKFDINEVSSINFDSTITAEYFKRGIYKFYMNGKEITYWSFHRHLYSFKLSEVQYNRYQSSIRIYKVGRFICLLGVGGSVITGATYRLQGTYGVLFFILPLFICEPIGLPILLYGAISRKYHFNKAIRLYNREMMKRNF